MAKILDGTALAKDVRLEVAAGVAEMREKHGVTPGLAAVLVGDDPASAIYVRNKGRACNEVGMFSETFHHPASTSQEELMDLLDRLNVDERFHGILLQLPLPDHMDEAEVIESVIPPKDIDGIHPERHELTSPPLILLPYDRRCMHEVVFSADWQKERGVSGLEVAKRLLDYGFHAPTMYFPLIVHEALMIEPTETETKETLDAFIQTLRDINQEATDNPELVQQAPHTTPVSRLDEAGAARRPNLRWQREG